VRKPFASKIPRSKLRWSARTAQRARHDQVVEDERDANTGAAAGEPTAPAKRVLRDLEREQSGIRTERIQFHAAQQARAALHGAVRVKVTLAASVTIRRSRATIAF